MTLDPTEPSPAPTPDEDDRECNLSVRNWVSSLISAVVAPVIVNYFFGPAWAVGVAFASSPVWVVVGPRPYLNAFGLEMLWMGGCFLIMLSTAVWMAILQHSAHAYLEIIRHNQIQ